MSGGITCIGVIEDVFQLLVFGAECAKGVGGRVVAYDYVVDAIAGERIDASAQFLRVGFI